MKKILFLLLCVGTLCSAQNVTIDGFWGIKFGASYEDVKTVMMQKKGCSQMSNPSNKLVLYLQGLNLQEKSLQVLRFISMKISLELLMF